MNLFRTTRVLLLPRGRFSSMLEMGGAPSAKADVSINVGKNNKLQTVALDFHLITRAIDTQRLEEDTQKSTMQKKSHTISTKEKQGILPNTDVVKDMARLLNVNLAGEENKKDIFKSTRDDDDDDLSLLTGMLSSKKEKKDSKDSVAKKKSSSSSPDRENKEVSDFDPSAMDIRAKYAAKLRSKVEGGLAGVELAKSKKEEALKQGDAAGHLVARSIAAANTVSKSGSKWMASTGTGSICTFLTNRSMNIALIPLPGEMLANIVERQKTKDDMELLAKQLPNVKFTLLGLGDDAKDIKEANDILKYVTSRVGTDPIATLVVSDRDDYLRSARDLGMFTCRVRKKNMPRGNVTTSYTVEDVKEVEDVVNEVNGISYNTVFNQ